MIKEFTRKIKSNENFSFIKFGDGEINCMRNLNGHNCDNHPYSVDLGNNLIESLVYLSDKSYIADWFYNSNRKDENFLFFRNIIENNKLLLKLVSPFEILLVGWGNLDNKNLFNFYRQIKKSDRYKIFIGPDRLSGVKSMLNINKHISIPLMNAYASYYELNSMIQYLPNDSIIILAVGMMSPVLAKDLLIKNSNITILDAGNAFDPIFVGQTRFGGQASPEHAKEYFKELL